jgi:hypothetical protein
VGGVFLLLAAIVFIGSNLAGPRMMPQKPAEPQ